MENGPKPEDEKNNGPRPEMGKSGPKMAESWDLRPIFNFLCHFGDIFPISGCGPVSSFRPIFPFSAFGPFFHSMPGGLTRKVNS